VNKCIIAGKGELPKLLAKNNKEFLIISITNLSYSTDFENISYEIDLLDFKKIIETLKKHNITELIFVGKFYRPKNFKNKLPDEVKKIIKETQYLGDDGLLRKIKVFFEQNGFQVLSPGNIIRHTFKKNEIIFNTKFQDNNKYEYFLDSISVAKELLDTISIFDMGQSVVVRGNHVLGIEGIEGTNELIKRCGKYFKDLLINKKSYGPILVKLPKLNQTLDFDMPVIGIDTIKLAYQYNYFGLAFSSKGVLVINEDEIRSFCSSKNFYLYIIDVKK
tara:strand:- start:77 stop:904 length:828 start_codon:yes stop_codon:yes gene_type:complete